MLIIISNIVILIGVFAASGENGGHAEAGAGPGVLIRGPERCDGGEAGTLRGHRRGLAGCPRGQIPMYNFMIYIFHVINVI